MIHRDTFRIHWRWWCWGGLMVLGVIAIGLINAHTTSKEAEIATWRHRLAVVTHQYRDDGALIEALTRADRNDETLLQLAQMNHVDVLAWEVEQTRQGKLSTLSVTATVEGRFTDLINLVTAWESGPPWREVTLQEMISPTRDDRCRMHVTVLSSDVYRE